MINIAEINYFSNILGPGTNPKVMPYGYEISENVDSKKQSLA